MKTLHFLFLAPLFALTALAADSSTPAAAPAPLPSAPAVVAAPAVQADPAAVEAALKAMRFDETIDKLLGPQKAFIAGRVRQMLFGMMKSPASSPKDLAAHEQQIMDAAWSEMKPEAIHADIARAYGEVFTTDELRAMADFYNTPLGQSISEKQPDVQQKLGDVLKVHMGQMSTKIRQMLLKFSMEERDKAKQAAAEAKAKQAAAGPAVPAAGSAPAPEPVKQ